MCISLAPLANFSFSQLPSIKHELHPRCVLYFKVAIIPDVVFAIVLRTLNVFEWKTTVWDKLVGMVFWKYSDNIQTHDNKLLVVESDFNAHFRDLVLAVFASHSNRINPGSKLDPI